MAYPADKQLIAPESLPGVCGGRESGCETFLTNGGGNISERRPNSISSLTKAVAAFWLVTIVTAMAFILHYSNSPGDAGAPPRHWPTESRLSFDKHRPTLLLFVHPKCPCSRATLGEFEVLLARCQDRVHALAIFVTPSADLERWTDSDLWDKARTIPGVITMYDRLGVEARRFHSQTSGHALLYAPDGDLMFEGGLTSSRGHSGDNAGRDALTALLLGASASNVKTPVFGCPLFEADCEMTTTEGQND